MIVIAKFITISFLDAAAIFLAFFASMSSGEVKFSSLVLFFMTLPLLLVTPDRSTEPPSKIQVKNISFTYFA